MMRVSSVKCPSEIKSNPSWVAVATIRGAILPEFLGLIKRFSKFSSSPLISTRGEWVDI